MPISNRKTLIPEVRSVWSSLIDDGDNSDEADVRVDYEECFRSTPLSEQKDHRMNLRCLKGLR